MRILSIGTFTGKGISNTCLHRTWALERLGKVDRIDSSLKHSELKSRVINRLFVRYKIPIRFHDRSLNEEILQKIKKNNYDLIWIDKGVTIEASTLEKIKCTLPHCHIVGYSPDNMIERHNQSQLFLDSLPFYDCYVTTKSYTIEALKRMGCRCVLFTNKSYEDSFHYPYKLSDVEKNRFGVDVGFIGAWEYERCSSILYLTRHGVSVKVFGNKVWRKFQSDNANLCIEPEGLFSDDYPKALSGFKISLCFLRKMNFDLQTSRTMEIPACGSLLMAERTPEHLQLFEEDKEAVFFSSDKELLAKCRYYLEHEEERLEIARAGRMRCIRSGYSNYETLKRIIKRIKDEDSLYL